MLHCYQTCLWEPVPCQYCELAVTESRNNTDRSSSDCAVCGMRAQAARATGLDLMAVEDQLVDAMTTFRATFLYRIESVNESVQPTLPKCVVEWKSQFKAAGIAVDVIVETRSVDEYDTVRLEALDDAATPARLRNMLGAAKHLIELTRKIALVTLPALKLKNAQQIEESKKSAEYTSESPVYSGRGLEDNDIKQLMDAVKGNFAIVKKGADVMDALEAKLDYIKRSFDESLLRYQPPRGWVGAIVAQDVVTYYPTEWWRKHGNTLHRFPEHPRVARVLVHCTLLSTLVL